MAYVKIQSIKTGTHLQQALDYIKNPDKTDNGILTFSYACTLNNTAKEFEETLKNTRHYGNNIAHHICQSFSPEDDVTPQKAIEIGRETMKRMYPNFQFLLCTHVDREHIHNHIIMCAANFKDYKKLHSNPDNLNNLRKVSDSVCEKNGISVIEKEPKTQRENLKKDIDNAVINSNNFDEFLGYMQFQKYEIKRNKYLYFKGENSKVFFNTKLLGTAYTEKSIRKRIENHIEIKNHKIHIYDDKIVKMSYRKRLKLSIDNALKNADDYNDFLRLLRSEDYEIKFGKHIAFKHITGSRYIRVESLGTEYGEDMLKLYFTNNEEYQKLKAEISEAKIDRIIVSDKAYNNRYIESQNVNIQIRILNYLNENGIKSLDELNARLEKAKKQVDINNQNIQNINTQISEKNEIIRSLRMYWQYKPFITELQKIKSPDEQEQYKAKNKNQLDRYNKSVEIINRSKKPDGTLPKAVNLNLEIEKLETLKNNILVRQNKAKAELSVYENLKYNIEQILNKDSIQVHQQENNDRKTKAKQSLQL